MQVLPLLPARRLPSGLKQTDVLLSRKDRILSRVADFHKPLIFLLPAIAK